tara:strand:+ start:273 stop:791 length:519 start_codon:yes stop_codon:yes gene_type:complete
MFNQEIILTPEECDSIIRMNNGYKRSGVASLHNTYENSYRTSYESPTKTTDGIRLLLLPKLSKYNIISLPNYFNILKYDIGQEFKKHKDIGLNSSTNQRYKTLIIQLSENYKGGELIIWDNDDEIVCDTTIGNMILFPSKLYHQAKPVLEGVRYSMVYFLKKHNFKIKESII